MSFRREKYVEFGGPDGGNGGTGGSVIFEATSDLNTLIDYRYQQHHKAKNGMPGMGRNRTGKSADDIILGVPVGTEILDEDSGDVLVDLKKAGQRFIALKGGRGGRGNASYVSSTNRAPRQSTPGEAAEEMTIRLRLKLLADVGLLGLPNAGKSTFLSAVSNAKPKIADYPFTTLAPQLGMIRHRGKDMVMADLPGLIAGAAQGQGLGHRFLKHTSRCRVLLHLIDTSIGQDPVEAYETIRAELEEYDADYGSTVATLPEVVALTKADAIAEEDIAAAAEALAAAGVRAHVISAQSKRGIDSVLDDLQRYPAVVVEEAEDDTEEEPQQENAD